MRVLTRKEFQDDVAKMWSEAVEAEYKDLIEKAVLAEREACLADVKKVFGTFDSLPQSPEVNLVRSLTSTFFNAIESEIELRIKS